MERNWNRDILTRNEKTFFFYYYEGSQSLNKIAQRGFGISVLGDFKILLELVLSNLL